MQLSDPRAYPPPTAGVSHPDASHPDAAPPAGAPAGATPARRTRTADPAPAFRPDIEGLRGIAVLAVVLYHAQIPGWPGGFVGVDVFFVLSGYLITGLLAKELQRTGRIDLPRFFARRARRLLPAALLVLLASVAAGALLFAPGEQQLLARTARATALYLSNAFFVVEASDYFAPGVETNPLLHTWSLAVEEQFYLVWPLIVLVACRGARPRTRLAWVMAGVGLVSFVACVVATRVNQPWAFFGTPFRAWEFAIGGLVGFVPVQQLSARTRALIAAAGALALAGAVFGFSRTTVFPGAAAALPVLGTAALILAGAEPTSVVHRALTAAPLTALGRWSYSWYLWHWPVLVFGDVLLPELTVPVRTALALASLAPALLSYTFVEKPLRFSPWLGARSRRSLALTAAVPALGVAASLAGQRYAARQANRPEQRAISIASRAPGVYDNDCIVRAQEVRAHTCIYGDSSGQPTVVLFGDSHAAQWTPAVDAIARRRHWRVVTLLKRSCPAADVPVYYALLKREYFECARWRTAALAEVARLRPALVVTSSSQGYVTDANPDAGALAVTEQSWRTGWGRTLVALTRADLPVLLIHDSPRPGYDIGVCLGRAAMRHLAPAVCDAPRSAAVGVSTIRAEAAAATPLPRVSTLDLTAQFCTAAVCPAVRDGRIVYRDSNHLSPGYVEYVARTLEERLTALVAAPAGRSRQAA